MAYTRALAAAYLGDEWSRYLVLANLTSEDAAGGVKTVVDRAWLALGVARSDLATATIADATDGIEAVLDKHMARRLHKALGDLVSVSLGDPNVSKQRQQAWDHLDKMLPTYDAAASGYETVSDGQGWQLATSIGLDIYEPEAT